MECEICQKEATETKTFYTCSRGPNTINLCHFHGCEMFLKGEQRFLEAYSIVGEKRTLKRSSRPEEKKDPLFL